jgi:dihydroneopterin triphosphate aldolase (PTPS-III) / 6-pyruvoyltetrahydropterin synthase
MASTTPGHRTTFEVNVSKETFKFNAAHFVAFPGFRERLHGHNYKLSVRLLGSRQIGQDGYVLDFGDVKKATKDVCKSLNEYFICPIYSNAIGITECRNEAGSETVKLVCQDGAEFVFPKSDCAMLPIVHSTAEELAIFLWGEILLKLDATYLIKRGIHTMEVTCAEAIGQEAVFRYEIPDTNCEEDIRKVCNVRNFIMSGDLLAKPCLPVSECPNCKIEKYK